MACLCCLSRLVQANVDLRVVTYEFDADTGEHAGMASILSSVDMISHSQDGRGHYSAVMRGEERKARARHAGQIGSTSLASA